MTKSPEFREEQRRVALAMAGALTTTVVVLGGIALFNQTTPALLEDRLLFTLRADLFVVISLAISIANVARLRFFSEEDIAGSSSVVASTEVRNAAAILQNTLEQVALAVFAHLIAAASFERSDALIVALVCFFCIGRVFFWAGYKHGAKGRAFGFALTFYPSIIILVAAVAAHAGSFLKSSLL